MEDYSSILVILNELMGYYRVMSRPKDCDACIRQALQTADAMGIQGTANYATMLLNIGTAQRVMGRMQEAEEQYQKAFAIYSREFTKPDYRMAALYNNRSILYAQTGRLQKARQDLEDAMKLIQSLDQSQTEIAITHVNTGNICFAMQDIAEGMRHMKEAVRIFELTEGKKILIMLLHYPVSERHISETTGWRILSAVTKRLWRKYYLTMAKMIIIK